MDFTVDPITLYKRDAKGSLQVWTISAINDKIWIEWGQEGGQLQQQYEDVDDGKGGRSVEEQILSRVDSRINSKLDQGYVNDRNVALTQKAVNRMGLARPMLAQPLDRIGIGTIDFSSSWLQFKYDGHRCLIHRSIEDELIAYSRNGKPITSIREILEDVQQMNIPDGYTLDGELYIHGMSLQRISSFVKRRQAATTRLTYVVYDIIPRHSENVKLKFTQRLALLKSLHWPQYDTMELKRVQLAPTGQCTRDEIQHGLEHAIKIGYEGLIIRQNTAPYEDGKRSKSLIKVKQFDDDEFLVIGIESSRVGLGVLICITPDGKQFKTPAPGDETQREHVLIHKNHFIGRHVRVQFAGYTDEGRPFHPIATDWREKQSE